MQGHSWTRYIVVCDKLGKPDGAVSLLQGMLSCNYTPDDAVIGAVLHACFSKWGSDATWYVLEKLYALGVKPDAKSKGNLARLWAGTNPGRASRLLAM